MAPPEASGPDAGSATLGKVHLDRGIDLGWALGAVLRAYVRAVEEVVSDLPGGARGYQVLALVQRAETAGRDPGARQVEGRGVEQSRPLHQGELARTLGIDRTVFTYLIDDLEAAALVERQADPRDRRRRSLALTGRGRDSLAAHQRAIDRIEDALMSPLGQDADEFRRLLGRLAPESADEDRMAELCRMAHDLGVAASGP